AQRFIGMPTKTDTITFTSGNTHRFERCACLGSSGVEGRIKVDHSNGLIWDRGQQLELIGMDDLIRTRKYRCHLCVVRLHRSMAPYNLTIMSTCTGTLPTFAGLGLLFVTAGIVD